MIKTRQTKLCETYSRIYTETHTEICQHCGRYLKPEDIAGNLCLKCDDMRFEAEQDQFNEAMQVK